MDNEIMGSENYNSHYFENYIAGLSYNNFLVKKCLSIKFKKALSLIEKHKSKGRLLDVGCAYGFFLSTASKTFEVFGCDISDHVVKKASKNFSGFKIYRYNIEKKTKFKSRFFDVVTAFEVLEHCENLISALKEIKRILKQNGIFLLSVPMTDLDLYDRIPTHVWHLSSYEWLKLLKENGFQPLELVIFPNILNKILSRISSKFILSRKMGH